jgi:hypothetical protein
MGHTDAMSEKFKPVEYQSGSYCEPHELFVTHFLSFLAGIAFGVILLVELAR